jgi:hypothetical protein
VVDAFFQALAPVELEVYAPAWAKRQPQAERLATAQAQPLERLRSAAASGERQCRHVDPAPRHVAAELEHAWEGARQALQQAEAAHRQRAQSGTPPATALSPTLPAAFRAMGHKVPALWPAEVLSQAQRNALRRWLLDTVVIQRARREQMHPRLGWRGGETTTCAVPGAVGARTDLPGAPAMAQQIRGLCAAGTSDDALARQLPQHGSRSPRRPAVLPSTVKGIRRTRGRMQQRSPSHPRRIAGALTGPQLAKALGIPPHGVSHQLKRGTVGIQREAQTRLCLFPDCPETLEACGP